MSCQCQQIIDALKITARDGLVRELNMELKIKDSRIATLEREVEMLHIDLRFSTSMESKL